MKELPEMPEMEVLSSSTTEEKKSKLFSEMCGLLSQAAEMEMPDWHKGKETYSENGHKPDQYVQIGLEYPFTETFKTVGWPRSSLPSFDACPSLRPEISRGPSQPESFYNYTFFMNWFPLSIRNNWSKERTGL